jgi:hypothetical protein
VSGKVAKKEHTQITSVLETIETFPPGLYGMEITEREGANGTTEYDVELREHRLEEISAHFNRFERVDEQPFEAVKRVSELNQRAYEFFVQPFVQTMSNETTASLLRQFHPLRAQRWAFSDLNPWLAWLGPAAEAIGATRKTDAQADMPLRRFERYGADMVSASLDYYRAMRDAATESAFFSLYGNMFSAYEGERNDALEKSAQVEADPRDLPFVKDALSSMTEGGYSEAVARVACLLARRGEPLPLARLVLRQQLAEDYAEYLPQLPADQWRRIRGEQEIIVSYEPDQALATLPVLLGDREDRRRLLGLIAKLLADSRVQGTEPTPAQLSMLEGIQAVLPVKAGRGAQASASAR